MHSCIELNVYREVCNTFVLSSIDECIEQSETVNLWLKIVLKESAEAAHLRIHHHDSLRDTLLAKRHTFISNSNSKIIYIVVLQGLCHLDCSRSISISLYHANHLRFWLHERAIVVEVLHDCAEVNFKDSLMDFLLQSVCNALKVEFTCTLNEDELMLEARENIVLQERICVGKETATNG